MTRRGENRVGDPGRLVAKPPARRPLAESADPTVIRTARLTWLSRRRLRVAGLADGRAVTPHPDEPDPLNTEERSRIAGELAEVVRLNEIHYLGLIGAARVGLATAQAELAWVRQQFDEAKEEILVEADLGRPVRYKGEQSLAEGTVAKRRRHEAEQRRAGSRALIGRLEASVHAADQAVARWKAEADRLRVDRDGVSDWLVAVYRHRCAIYDAALLRRHRMRAVVRGRLIDFLQLANAAMRHVEGDGRGA